MSEGESSKISKSKTSQSCCVVYGCSNYPAKTPNLSFHKFPTDENQRKVWTAAVKRKYWSPSTSSVICSDHFEKSCFQIPPGLSRKARLHRGAVPTIFTTYPQHLQPKPAKQRRVLHRSVESREELTIGNVSPPSTVVMSQSVSSTAQPPLSESSTLASTSLKKKTGRPKVPLGLRVQKLKRKVNTLTQQVIRLKRKSQIKDNMIEMLKQENNLQKFNLADLDGCLAQLVQTQLSRKTKKKVKQYSEQIKTFALTVYYYSPRTYAYLRTVLCLPNPRTLRKWLETINCEPGFMTDAIEHLTNKEVPYSLVVDSMSIRKQLVVSKGISRSLEGYNSIGDRSKLASEALVFLVVPILGGPRVPIAFFYIDKIDSTLQSQLILHCLKLTAEHHVNIVNVTCDGCNSNLTTLKKLGASIPENPAFKHPTLAYNVTVTLDPVHMLKLARNAFATLRCIRSAEGLIDFKYIEALVELQNDIGLRLAGNKLTQKHLNWTSIKMKVKLAAQMLSSSVADAIQYLSLTDSRFKDAGPTITFIRQVDKIFDILNCHNAYGKGYKGPVTRGNIETVNTELNEVLEYLESLKLMNGSLITTSRRKTFVIGFRCASTSLINVARYLFDIYPACNFVLSYKLNQDHLETLFSKIRARGGFNNNPDVVTFRSAMRALLAKSDITPSPNANCLELGPPEKPHQLHLFGKRKKSTEDDETESDNVDDQEHTTINMVELNQPVADIVEYIGGYVIKSLKINCDECSASLSTPQTQRANDDMTLISAINRGGLITPVKAVNSIFLTCEKVVRYFKATGSSLPPDVHKKIVTATMNAVFQKGLQQQMSCASHSTMLIKTLVFRYALIRIRHETTLLTCNISNLRQKLNRLVVFSNI